MITTNDLNSTDYDEDAALYALVEQVTEHLKEKLNKAEKWITDEEAMKRLNITSKTTLQKYRDEGRIQFSQWDQSNGDND